MATFTRYRGLSRDQISQGEEETDASSTAPGSSTPSSLYYTLLPSLLQRRVSGKLRSLKQALSHYDSVPPVPTRTRHTRIPSVESITLPPSYQSNDSEAGSRPSSSSSASSSRPTSSSRQHPAIPLLLEEQHSGVDWKYARPGISLLELASQEATSNSLEAAQFSTRTNFVRRQYIDGLVCVLRGLPEDLSQEEQICLRDAMPKLRGPDDTPLEGGEVAFRSKSRRGDLKLPGTQRQQEQSTLHRSVATVTLYIFLAISFLTPYIQLLLQRAYQIDREYKLSERALAQSVIAADAAGRQTILVARHVCGWNEGKVGEAIKEMGVYCVQGFGGGVYEGVGEGMRAVGLREGAPERTGRRLNERR